MESYRIWSFKKILNTEVTEEKYHRELSVYSACSVLKRGWNTETTEFNTEITKKILLLVLCLRTEVQPT